MAEPLARGPVAGQRIAAGVIDLALLGALALVFAALFGDFGTAENESTGAKTFSINLDGLPFLAFVAVSLAYYTALEGLTGKTVGKRLLGLHVERLDGRPIGWGAAIARNLLRFVDGLPLFYVLGIVVIAVTRGDQRLGDLAAKTTVVGD